MPRDQRADTTASSLRQMASDDRAARSSAARRCSGTPADFGNVMASEVAKWKKAVEFSGATVE